MYTPAAYLEADPANLHAFIRKWSFATLFTCGDSGPCATHLPFLLDTCGDANGQLISHLARNNGQVRDLSQGAPALVVFQGPHAFISPSWYVDQMTFPTWNYTAVHVYGTPVIVEDTGAIRGVLEAMVATYDTPVKGTWKFSAMPEELTMPRLSRIVALKIPIDRMEGKMKLNQDRSLADRLSVIEALEAGTDPVAKAVAELMRGQPDVGATAPQGGTRPQR